VGGGEKVGMKTNERIIYVRVALLYSCLIIIIAIFRFVNFVYFCIFFTDLLHCTNEPNVSIPQLANLLIERSQNTNWVVVFKSLVTTHHLMCYGNEVLHKYVFPCRTQFKMITLFFFFNFLSDSDSHSISPPATAAFN
jgi:hypothetical protein